LFFIMAKLVDALEVWASAHRQGLMAINSLGVLPFHAPCMQTSARQPLGVLLARRPRASWWIMRETARKKLPVWLRV
jgi:hypothetical protein